ALETLPRIGPYHVLESMGCQYGAELLLGYDPRLLRRVWIRTQPIGAPATDASLRQLRRPGRLRWLAARRSDQEAWDAYEALSGQPLPKILTHPQDWNSVRYWLLDLAEELRAAARDGTMPVTLGLERIWITAEGRAKLLDFAAPESDDRPARLSSASDIGGSSSGHFLGLAAAAALQASSPDAGTSALVPSVPLPLHAVGFLETLKPGADLERCVADLRRLVTLPARITRGQRALLVGGALAFPLLVAGLVWGLAAFRRDVLSAAPELATLNECLSHYDQLQREATSHQRHQELLEAFEVYIAGRFAPLVTNPVQWDNPVTKAVIAPGLRQRAEQILDRGHPAGAMNLDAAAARLEQFFHKSPEAAAREALQNPNLFLGALLVGYLVTGVFVILPCLLAALLFRGGALVALLGIVFVDRNGRPASRWRVTARNLVAWLPLVLVLPGAWFDPRLPLGVGALVLLLAGVSLLLAHRGLQDKLAGTWPVPR
ncbi:MAG: RDD family protein, partial [Verrucomicrobia bacterium]|nr:RDD family protein [Verrucomicrobiota bacterium]